MRKNFLKALSIIGYWFEEGIALSVLFSVLTILFVVLLSMHFDVNSVVAYVGIMFGATILGCIVAAIISFVLSFLGMLADDAL